MVDRGQNIAIVNRSGFGLGGCLIGGANDLADPHASTREKSTLDGSPVIAASILVDFWRATKFAPHDDGHIIGQATVVDVFDERRDARVERGQMLLQMLEVVSVRVPESEATVTTRTPDSTRRRAMSN